MNRPLALALALTLAACGRDPTEASFSENVGSAFEECNAAEIRFLSAKHNFMLAFEPCGSNNFSAFSWSPAGTHLYFQLSGSHHIMNADAPTKDTITVPTDPPIAAAAWLDANRLAIPVGPAPDASAPRVEVFDHVALTRETYPLTGLSEPRDLQRGLVPSGLWFTALKDGRRGVFRLDTDQGTIEQPLEWIAALPDPPETFTITPAADAIAIGAAGSVSLYRASTGEPLGAWPRATRGSLHPGGQWLALEYVGDPISPFYQRSWDELSDRARTREQARAEAFRETLPEWYPKEVVPPRISLVNRSNGERWDLTGVLGDRFEWYVAADAYASLVLWGYEGKQLNTNVLLGSLGDRLRAIEQGEEMTGLARWRDATTPPPVDPGGAPPADEPAAAAPPASPDAATDGAPAPEQAPPAAP